MCADLREIMQYLRSSFVPEFLLGFCSEIDDFIFVIGQDPRSGLFLSLGRCKFKYFYRFTNLGNSSFCLRLLFF